MTWSIREFDVTLVGTSFWTCSMVLKDAILVPGKGDARERQALRRAKHNEQWGKKDMEHHDWLCNIINHHIKFHSSDDLWTFLTPLILIWQLTHHDSHSLEAVSHSSSSQVIDQAAFPFISYFSHDESLCFVLLLIFFLIYHLIHQTVLRWNFLEYFSYSLLSNHLQIS